MDLHGVVALMYQGAPILGLFHGKDFQWPDPWTDIWDEGSSVYWETAWHNQWSV